MQGDSNEAWAARRLDAALYVVGDDGTVMAADRARTPAAARIARADGGTFALVAARPLALNGAAPLGGLAVLRDRDEIRTPSGARLYFSTEQLPVVEPYPGADEARCARCGDALRPGDAAVRCTGCGLWYHHGEESCFAYAAACASCKAPTRLDAGFAWSPENI